jgi:hypothetical protein
MNEINIQVSALQVGDVLKGWQMDIDCAWSLECLNKLSKMTIWEKYP